jgi:hypothetical protein
MQKWLKDQVDEHYITACKQYCLAAGATQGNIAYTQTVIADFAAVKNNTRIN